MEMLKEKYIIFFMSNENRVNTARNEEQDQAAFSMQYKRALFGFVVACVIFLPAHSILLLGGRTRQMEGWIWMK